MSTYSLSLFGPLLRGNGPLGDFTPLLRPTWRRSIRRIGGCWLGTLEIKAADVGRSWLDELFTYNFLHELRESDGGDLTWRGAAVQMHYQRGGDLFVRDATTMANAIRSIYTTIGANLLTNGSGESGVWTAYNGATVTQDSTWSTHGSYSIKIVVADTTIRGATVQSGITITAAKQYILRGSLKVVSGNWLVMLLRDDTGASLATYSTAGALNEMAFDQYLDDTNAYAGNVTIRIVSQSVAGTIYADALVFQLGPTQAQTGWYTDVASIAVYGRKEAILLRGGKSSADANAECRSLLLDTAWANPQPPANSQTWVTAPGDDTLTITYAGYWYMLNWVYTTLHGTRGCSNWVTALASLMSAYVTPGTIDTNVTDFLIDDRGPLLVGDILGEIAATGESNGAKFSIGVYADRKLRYERVPQALIYHRRGGHLLSMGGEIEPWRALPGWALWEDMPIGPGALTDNPQHDPRWAYLEEVELLPPSTSDPDGAVAFKL
jgi:hypothetical protein